MEYSDLPTKEPMRRDHWYDEETEDRRNRKEHRHKKSRSVKIRKSRKLKSQS